MRPALWRAWLGALVAASLWAFLSPAVPPLSGAGGPPGLDKAGHAGLFAALTVAALGSVSGRRARLALALLAYGALVELVQSFLPLRSADGWDLVADAVGIALGFAAWRAARQR